MFRSLDHRRTMTSRMGWWLFACALAIRIAVLPGFMPVVANGELTIKMCTGQGAVTVPLPGKSDPAHGVKETCPFGVLAAPPLLAFAIALPGLQPVADDRIITGVRERTPHIGAPAPPPPQTGPPLA